jgi:hypothetical protein
MRLLAAAAGGRAGGPPKITIGPLVIIRTLAFEPAAGKALTTLACILRRCVAMFLSEYVASVK